MPAITLVLLLLLLLLLLLFLALVLLAFLVLLLFLLLAPRAGRATEELVEPPRRVATNAPVRQAVGEMPQCCAQPAGDALHPFVPVVVAEVLRPHRPRLLPDDLQGLFQFPRLETKIALQRVEGAPQLWGSREQLDVHLVFRCFPVGQEIRAVRGRRHASRHIGGTSCEDPPFDGRRRHLNQTATHYIYIYNYIYTLYV